MNQLEKDDQEFRDSWNQIKNELKEEEGYSSKEIEEKWTQPINWRE